MDFDDETGPASQPAESLDVGELRRLARRKRHLSSRTRRLLPGVVVGSASLIGTGAVVVWVGNRPGIKPVSVSTAYQAPATTSPTDSSVVAALQAQLRADAAEVQKLSAAYGSSGKRSSSVSGAGRTGAAGAPSASNGGYSSASSNSAGSSVSTGAGTTGASVGGVAVPTVQPLGSLPSTTPSGSTTASPAPAPVSTPAPAPTPTAPPVTAAPAPPPVQTTTGASHAAP